MKVKEFTTLKARLTYFYTMKVKEFSTLKARLTYFYTMKVKERSSVLTAIRLNSKFVRQNAFSAFI